MYKIIETILCFWTILGILIFVGLMLLGEKKNIDKWSDKQIFFFFMVSGPAWWIPFTIIFVFCCWDKFWNYLGNKK